MKTSPRIVRTIAFILSPMVAVYTFDLFLYYGLDAYSRWPSIDIPMHIIGGFVSAWTAYLFWLQAKRRGAVVKPEWFVSLFLVGFASFAAVMWEIYEFIHDQIYIHAQPFQPSLADTMKDQFMGVCGSVIFVFVLQKILQRKKIRT